jgi:phage baseplate assembly protein W
MSPLLAPCYLLIALMGESRMKISGLGIDIKLRTNIDDNGIVRSDLCLSNSGDLEVVNDRDNVIQAIWNRLATYQGELSDLGHQDYGSRLDDMIGEPNTPVTHRIIETMVKNCIGKDHRIEKIIEVKAIAHRSDPNRIEILVYLKLHSDHDKLKLELPFYLEGGF